MSIEVIKIETGYAVKFPFELKDNFRSVFKTAKWNPVKKQWEVGVRSYKKLSEWAEVAEGVSIAIDAEKELQENEADLFAAKAQLQTMKDSVLKRISDADPIEKILQMLNSVKDEIEIVKEEQKQAEKVIFEKRAQIHKLVAGVVNLGLVETMKSKMSAMHRSVGDRGTFDSYQDTIREERDKLRKIGFTSRGLDYLSSVNYNQPERDNIAKCPDILLISKYKPED